VALDGLGVGGPTFNENLPLRNGISLTVRLQGGSSQTIQSPVTNTVEGAMAIQDFLDDSVWVQQSGSPVAFAPYLRKNPLAGGPAKPVIFQFAKGDETVPNPNVTAILRAGDLADRATYYRHDLAFADNHNLPWDPHTFLVDNTTFQAITLGAQEQIATFFASDGMKVFTTLHSEVATGSRAAGDGIAYASKRRVGVRAERGYRSDAYHNDQGQHHGVFHGRRAVFFAKEICPLL
jgi:hypothetical protein